MAEPRASPEDSLTRLHPEPPSLAEAQTAIPTGIVQQAVLNFENRIASHSPSDDITLIERSLTNVDNLIRTGDTYAGHLRLAEALSLSHLTTGLINFLRDHDNMYRCAVRSRHAANIASPDMDLLTRVDRRLVNLRNVYSLNIITETRSPHAWQRMRAQGQFEREIRELGAALQDETIRILLRMDTLLPHLAEPVEMENIGPDHDIDDFGREIQLSAADAKLQEGNALGQEVDEHDHTRRCCICLEAYHGPEHPAFFLTRCGHIVGKPCMANWLNSTARNANLCPHCRTPQCARRPRRPVRRSLAEREEQGELELRLRRSGDLMRSVSEIHGCLYGREAVRDWFDDAMRALNERFFFEGVGFVFVADESTEVGWRLRRADWGAAAMLD
ncbi:hypothetical protein BU26DRAFT_256612 [Trematosphaeria pertusa]|uniref:RING-type domain-containing protein n=1 Tax=Trematosphaeria pertusa TaxID=390896 RepID=A0A6A6IS32_9PLEO|nr:uncharacterized protein BU26DRAFT_256612 [Trematosphaeria pertusa]KAF2252410.1 hypothetical protein BU26DRAFT_256612 [Trematosphaeria pertusa]